MSLWRVETVALTILGYPMSWIELVGTITYLWSVWLMAHRRMSTWPVGIVSVLLYLLLFWQIRLYSDALEQVYYLGASVVGWVRWTAVRLDEGEAVATRWSSSRGVLVQLALVATGTVALGYAMGRAHVTAPAWFPEPASYPYLDAGTTIASFVAMGLLAMRRIESWVWWIGVDVVGIALYWAKDVRFVALLYVVLLGLAVRGLLDWRSGVSRASRVSSRNARR